MTAILDLIGNTPLVTLSRITRELPENVRIHAKLERCNPGGSVKDRAALNMIREGIASGALSKDKVILDSTSGNTGIALAMIGAAMGFKVKLVMPQNVSEERKRICLAYGAEIVYSDPMEGSDGSIVLSREIYEANPELYFKPDQYNNPANPAAHEKTTGPEIWQQTEGRVSHFIASTGTSGTLMGTGRYLKAMNPATQIIAAGPDSPFHGIEGLKYLDAGIVPGIYDAAVHDEQIGVDTDVAYDLTLRLAREEGILCGQSCGCVLAAALKIGKREAAAGRAAEIVIIFPDGGEKYLTTAVFRDAPLVAGAGI